MGIEIRDERPAIHYAPPGGDAAAFMRLKGSEVVQAEGNPPQLIICFLPRKPIDIYGDVRPRSFPRERLGKVALLTTSASFPSAPSSLTAMSSARRSSASATSRSASRRSAS